MLHRAATIHIIVSNLRFIDESVATCALENDGIDYAPKIDEICNQRSFGIAHIEVAHLRCLNLLKRLRHIGIERR